MQVTMLYSVHICILDLSLQFWQCYVATVRCKSMLVSWCQQARTIRSDDVCYDDDVMMFIRNDDLWLLMCDDSLWSLHLRCIETLPAILLVEPTVSVVPWWLCSCPTWGKHAWCKGEVLPTRHCPCIYSRVVSTAGSTGGVHICATAHVSSIHEQ